MVVFEISSVTFELDCICLIMFLDVCSQCEFMSETSEMQLEITLVCRNCYIGRV